MCRSVLSWQRGIVDKGGEGKHLHNDSVVLIHAQHSSYGDIIPRIKSGMNKKEKSIPDVYATINGD